MAFEVFDLTAALCSLHWAHWINVSDIHDIFTDGSRSRELMRTLRSAISIAVAVSATACASSTSFNSSWKDPDAAPVSLAGKKVLAVVQIRDEARRRRGEDQLAEEITRRGGIGVASYTLFPSNGRQQNEDAAQARARSAGMSRNVLMHFTKRERTVRIEPRPMSQRRTDPYYGRPWGAWGRGWNAMWDTETVRTDVDVMVETRVYSLEQEKLLWVGNRV